MRALVISGGGSKGAFAGGVAQYLLEIKKCQYDLFLGTSTGSLLIPHLALGNIHKIHGIYTNVNMGKIFNISPFVVKEKDGIDIVTINHFNVIRQFFKGKRTFGESKGLQKYIKDHFSISEFNQLKKLKTDVVVTVTNLSRNEAEYKSIKDCSYDEFCDWIWISSNYIPFMSLVSKNNSEYGDGGFSSLVPIREAIHRGATEIDVVILETEVNITKNAIGKNPFSLMIDLFRIALDQVEKHDIAIGKLIAKNKNVKLNLFYTPTKLTNNALIFNKEEMKKWWEEGYEYAQNKSEIMSDNR
ncbi:patatin-like phospholipase family protein [Flavobacterium sp. F-65]|jgi:NTE family protein|uniref:Patatin-like phospholipase family protein n=1 Tax=Flavobacterium pisciphilum TaxID=2893755 RepID=A0ABS8MMW0_9FLAO|nr:MULTISPECIES: patatin-like phospholipase family protein [unclassified Flavobacterium]AYN03921.1 patatin-like phospholipase family protein [Flavobacterium sp. 140616W15]MCC9070092.1 patatin-like phospholipase family protein [Flavobacterium sp. F-65]MCD0475832.1 patatin-like phospholipase family protein [Flavobacterium sp. EDS]